MSKPKIKVGTKPFTLRNPVPPEYRRENYMTAIARMYGEGICSKETALSMAERVEVMVGEGSE
jgi:hypothetical protein